MKLAVTKKEYEEIKSTVKLMLKECELIEIFDDVSIDDIFPEVVITHDTIIAHIGDDGIDIFIDEDIVSDIIHMIYQPLIVKIVQWIGSTIKLVKGAAQKILVPATDYIKSKYSLDKAVILINGDRKKSDKAEI